jgi:large subunit ribosomal protein L10
MLTKQQKKEIVEELSKRIADSKTVVICDFKGLSVADLAEIRGKLRENNAEMMVAKKTLAKLAFEKAGIEIDTKSMEGQLAFVYGGESEVASPKTLAEFSKKKENLKILAGVLENKVIDADGVVNLSKIPSREELLAKMVGVIKSPISGFVNALSGNLRNLVQVLNQIKESK